LDHSEVFDSVDWLFKARGAWTIAYTATKELRRSGLFHLVTS